MKYVSVILFIILNLNLAYARMVEDGMGYYTKKPVSKPISTYQKWLSLKSKVEKKIRVFFGADKTEELVTKRLEEKAKQEALLKEEKEKLIEQLPDYKVSDKGINEEELAKTKKEIRSKSVVNIKEEAIAPDASLKTDKAGVPYFSLSKKVKKKVVYIKDIPHLSIGRERTISAADFEIKGMRSVLLSSQKIKQLQSPRLYTQSDISSWLRYEIQRSMYEKINIKTLQSMGLTMNAIQRISWSTRKDVEVKEKTLDSITEEEYRMLQALIMEEKRSCHNAAGIFYPLRNSKNKVVENTSEYYWAICNQKMGFYHESIPALLKVIGNKQLSADSRKTAFKLLVNNVPYEHEIKVGEGLLKEDTKGISQVNEGAFYYYISKAKLRTKQYGSALSYALKVPRKSRFYIKSQYAASIAEYLSGAKKESLSRQKSLLSYMKTKVSVDKNIDSLVRLNLARFAFQNQKLNTSIKYFRDIDRKHPLWMDSLHELGWAQLLNQDEPGAIGNMYSLHTPFFKMAFKPESYAIRSIGYLNLCHYGDAYHSLTNLENKYQPVGKELGVYLKKYSSNGEHYKTILDYLKTNKKKVRGLSSLVLREVARKKDFLNTQEHINKIVDEKNQYSFIDTFSQQDIRKVTWLKKKNKQRISDLNRKVKIAKSDKKQFRFLVERQKALEYEKSLSDFYDFKKEVIEHGKKNFAIYKKRATNSLANVSASLKQVAGEKIAHHLKKIKKTLAGVFKNNEFLRYEVFAGSGENIRFHVGGGQSEEKRLPASAKPQSKDLKWQYNGEFWNDEVGFYRSTLKSNCPKR